jgi:hypothetical protein
MCKMHDTKMVVIREDNIKTDLGQIGYDDVDSIHLTHDKVHWWERVK